VTRGAGPRTPLSAAGPGRPAACGVALSALLTVRRQSRRGPVADREQHLRKLPCVAHREGKALAIYRVVVSPRRRPGSGVSARTAPAIRPGSRRRAPRARRRPPCAQARTGGRPRRPARSPDPPASPCRRYARTVPGALRNRTARSLPVDPGHAIEFDITAKDCRNLRSLQANAANNRGVAGERQEPISRIAGIMQEP
jgi:hypothetical protein